MFHSLERATAEANHIFSSDAHLLLYSGPALINGRWDPIGELLEASTLVTERMAQLPYVPARWLAALIRQQRSTVRRPSGK